MMNQTSDIERRTLTLNRLFDAPRDLVWAAWTESEHIAHWWGPAGMKTKIKKHDFTEGGEWEYTLQMPNGQDFISYGTYSKITPRERIETTANFIPMTEGVTLIALFEDDGDQTAFTFKVIHPTEAYCKQQEEMGFYNGWGSVFEGLNTYLGTI
ncbi:MAG: SRPBCC domain-containing protein [Bacteroidota bacterium]